MTSMIIQTTIVKRWWCTMPSRLISKSEIDVTKCDGKMVRDRLKTSKAPNKLKKMATFFFLCYMTKQNQVNEKNDTKLSK